MLYDSTQTFTSTVFEHLNSFSKYSEHSWFYIDYRNLNSDKINLSCFDIVVIHYSVRLPFDQLSNSLIQKLNIFQGLKLLFIQDEYEHTNKAKKNMRKVKFHLIFTVVPDKSIPLIYPPNDFPGTTFISNLTGYVPDDLNIDVNNYTPPSKRSCIIAYRGRPLPIKFGRLGQDKINIGKQVKANCKSKGIKHDIAWKEEDRIYGNAWYQFIISSKAMLGTESGSNVFDWDGNLQDKIDKYKKKNLFCNEQEIYDAVVRSEELDGTMNQISPRVFEMIAARTVMILYEGNYSGVLTPHKHYIPLKKDFSNLDEVFSLLNDGDYIDKMVEKTYEDIINSNKYSYQTFIKMIDKQINIVLKNPKLSNSSDNLDLFRASFENVCTYPVRSELYKPLSLIHRIVGKILSYLPSPISSTIIRILGKIQSLNIFRIYRAIVRIVKKILSYLPSPISSIIIRILKKFKILLKNVLL